MGDMACADVATTKAKATAINLIIIFLNVYFLQDPAPPRHPSNSTRRRRAG